MITILKIYLSENVTLEKLELLNEELKQISKLKVIKSDIIMLEDLSIEKFNPLKINSYIEIVIKYKDYLDYTILDKIIKKFDFISNYIIDDEEENKINNEQIRVNKNEFLSLMKFFDNENEIINSNGKNIRYLLRKELFKMQLTNFSNVEKEFKEIVKLFIKKLGLNVEFDIIIKNSVNIYIENNILKVIYRNFKDFLLCYIETFCNINTETKTYKLEIEIFQYMDTINIQMIDYTNILSLDHAITRKDIKGLLNLNNKSSLLKKILGFDFIDDENVINKQKILKLYKKLYTKYTKINSNIRKNKYLNLSIDIVQNNYVMTTYILKVSSKYIAIDMYSVSEMIDISIENIEKIDGIYFYKYNNKQYPIINLLDILNEDVSDIKYEKAFFVNFNGIDNLVLYDEYIRAEEIYVSEYTNKNSYIINDIKLENLDKVYVVDIKKVLKDLSY